MRKLRWRGWLSQDWGKCLQWLRIQPNLPRDLSSLPPTTNIFNAHHYSVYPPPPLEIVPRILILRGLGAEKWTIYSDRLLDMSPPLSNGSPTDKSEIPIWFPQSNVTKSNVTKPLLQIGFLTHWKEGSGILVRLGDRDRRTFNIQTILVASQKRRADSSTKSSNPFPRICEKNISWRIWWTKKSETQHHSP